MATNQYGFILVQFVFTNPQVFWLLCLVPLLLLPELWRAFKRKKSLRGLQQNQQLARLLRLHQPVSRLPTLLLRLLAFVLAVCALAKPEWGTESVTRFQQSKNLYLAIDLSRSMWADDVSPSRLERAKLLARDLITDHPGQAIGLISFTDQAFVEVPPTADSAALLEQLNYLSPATSLGDGTDLSQPVALIHELTQSQDSSLLVLLSDGENLSEERLEALAELELSRVPILAIGIGTEEGRVVADPDLPGSFIRDASNELVLSRLEPQLLQELAQGSQGQYLEHSQEPVLHRWVETQLAATENRSEALYSEQVPRSQYALFLGLALLSLFMGELLRSSWAQNLSKKPAASKTASHNSAANKPTLGLLLGLSLAGQSLPAPAQSIEQRQESHSSKSDSSEASSGSAAALAPSMLSPKQRFLDALESSWKQVQGKDYQSALAQSTSALLSPETDLQAEAHTHLAHALHQRGLADFQQTLQQQKASESSPANSAEPDLSQVPWQQIATDWQDALEHLSQASKLSQNSQLQTQQQTIAENLAALEQLRSQPPTPQQPDQGQEENQEQNQDQAQQQSPPQGEEESPEQGQEQRSNEDPNSSSPEAEEGSPAEDPSDAEPNASANPDPEAKTDSNPDSNPEADPNQDQPEDQQNRDSAPANTEAENSPSASRDQPNSPTGSPSNTSPPDQQESMEEMQQADSARIQDQLLRGYADEVPNLLGGQKRRNSRKRSW